MNQLTAVHIRRFKAIADAPMDLGALNVLVGANNSGKSSIIQGLHFGVGILQSVLLSGNWGGKGSISTSINPTQLIYTPSEDVNALAMGGKLKESAEEAIRIEYTLASGEKPAVSIRKGRNRNILVNIDSPLAAKRLATLETPFSVFSPGLAGVAKNEQLVSDGVLLRTIARGDANLVLRNILLRLWRTPQWDPFLADLREIFPDLEFEVAFKKESDEFIRVMVKAGQELIPIELVGTGILQATQILAYIHKFGPSIVVLDEPDSHLHPNNQRLLCSLLRKVAEERETQILLTTHSRHVVDAIGHSTKFLWVRNSTIEPAGADDEIGVLMDIGALDVKERAAQPGVKVVVLTEDENTRGLDVILASSGFDMSATTILPYYGVSKIKQLRPLVRMIQNINPNAKLLLHRDRDYLTDHEAREWETQVRNLSVEPFLTDGVDVESHFIDSTHLAQCNDQGTAADFVRMINAALETSKERSIEHYVNGRIEIARSNGTHASINHGKLAIEAATTVGNHLKRWSHGKTILKTLRQEYRREFGQNLRDVVASEVVAVSSLQTLAKKVFGASPKPVT